MSYIINKVNNITILRNTIKTTTNKENSNILLINCQLFIYLCMAYNSILLLFSCCVVRIKFPLYFHDYLT